MSERLEETTIQAIQARLELEERLRETLTIDLGGHFRTGRPGQLETLRDHVLVLWVWSFLRRAPGEWIRKLLAGETVEPFPLTGRELGFDFRTCGECGTKITGVCDGVTVRLRGPEDSLCPCPEGMPPYSFEIDIPSGRMVVANDLREFFPVEDVGEGYALETSLGTRQVTMQYAKAGMAHAFVGNTSPGVYRIDTDRYTIAVCGRTPDTKETIFPEGVWVAWICTDLWWYSIVDEGLLRAQGFKGKTLKVVDVTPGRYRFTHHIHTLDRDDHSKPQIYTTIERV